MLFKKRLLSMDQAVKVSRLFLRLSLRPSPVFLAAQLAVFSALLFWARPAQADYPYAVPGLVGPDPQQQQQTGGTQPSGFPAARSMNGMVPKFTPDFLKQLATSRLMPGTIITGVLQDELSSKKNKQGDVFAIVLEDGYEVQGQQVLPKQTRILGTVMFAKPALMFNRGTPGQLQVSLQTLVLPDGRSTPFYGFIEHNPNHDLKFDPKKTDYGQQMATYGKSAVASAGQWFSRITSRVGYRPYRPGGGLDFVLDKGEVIPIKVNRPINLTNMSAPVLPGQSQPVPGLTGAAQALRPGAAPSGLANSAPVGLAAPPAALMPSLSAQSEPSAAFNKPLRTPASLPDPF